MPRRPRLDFPGALHHVIVRGIERRKIFYSDRDRSDCLNRLATLVINSQAGLYAWSLMPNHAHVLLRTGSLPLSRVAQRWLGPYATTFNLIHHRAGHLLQNRFKNTLVEEESYLLELVRYIHLNPVRSKLAVTIDSLDDYAWTGHSVLVGKQKFTAQDCDFVLARIDQPFLQKPGDPDHLLRKLCDRAAARFAGSPSSVVDGARCHTVCLISRHADRPAGFD